MITVDVKVVVVRYWSTGSSQRSDLQSQLDQLSRVLRANHSSAEQRELSHRLLQLPLVRSLLQNSPSKMLLLISGADFSGEPLSIDHTVHVPVREFLEKKPHLK